MTKILNSSVVLAVDDNGKEIVLAGIVPGLQKTAEIASVQAAAAVIVTAVFCPLLTSRSVKKWGSPKLDKEAGRRESFF
jgi:hypothetical protein